MDVAVRAWAHTELPADGEVYAGLMSGTSLDAIDGVVVHFDAAGRPQVLAEAALPLPADLRAELLALNASGPDELHRAALASVALADGYAEVVLALQRATPEVRCRAVGVHGQTVRHRPEVGYTLQLMQPARLAERVGIDVIADFRSRDVAAGGQGAPLVPACHAAVFGHDAEHRALLNLGGIANVSWLPAGGGTVLGFDTGPANLLLDLWCARHTGQPYDAAGAWAATGRVVPALLETLVASEPWFALPPPKSTGRDQFHADWLEARLQSLPGGVRLAPADVQATLVALTAHTVAAALAAQGLQPGVLYVCGGGAHNPVLMTALAQALAPVTVLTTDALGVPPQQVEALAFAWLARAHVRREPGNLASVTGARGGRVLGACYPA